MWQHGNNWLVLMKGIWVCIDLVWNFSKQSFEEKRKAKSLRENKIGMRVSRHSNNFKVLLSFCQSLYRGHLGFAYTASTHTSSGWFSKIILVFLGKSLILLTPRKLTPCCTASVSMKPRPGWLENYSNSSDQLLLLVVVVGFLEWGR